MSTAACGVAAPELMEPDEGESAYVPIMLPTLAG